MDTDLEEIFVECLTDPSPQSPPAFLELPTMPDGDGQGLLPPDDMVLSYAARMLMEDTDNKFLYKYYDSAALLQVQQPFAEILSSPSFSANNGNDINMCNTRGGMDLLQGGSGDQNTFSSAFSKGTDVVGAFLKGMEEASRFLPTDNVYKRNMQANQIFGESSTPGRLNKRYNRDEHPEERVGRASKAIMVMGELEEMRDEMMVRGYEICIKDMYNLRIAKTNEVEKNRLGGSKAKKDMVDLCTLLIHCAQAVAVNNHMGAHELLKQIKGHASKTGDAAQRLAYCFAKGLEVRLSGTGNQLCPSLMVEGPSTLEFLKVYNLYMAACYFIKATFIFNAMAIEHSMAGKNKLHIVDYGLQHGLQWAGLLHRMANREGSLPKVKVTAISHLQPRPCPAERVEEIGHQLSKCASKFGVPFKFHAITAKWEEVCIDNLDMDADEVLVVSDLFSLGVLMDESIYFDDPSPRDTVLNNIRRMQPDIFIQSIVNYSYGTSFLTRFREALFYYRALFDMMDATMLRESKLRTVLEQGMLGRSVFNVIACEGMDLLNHPERYKQWQVRNQRAGLRQLPLKPNIVNLLKDKVKKDYHKDFLLSEDGHWLVQGWMGRILYAHSTWVADKGASR
nr:unnamed protein product [Digitaria exilis]CAB3502813.1 unnamed protein product [Digitaria exilis]